MLPKPTEELPIVLPALGDPLALCQPTDVALPPPEPPYQPWLRGLPLVYSFNLPTERQAFIRSVRRSREPVQQALVRRGCIFPFAYGPWPAPARRPVKLRVIGVDGVSAESFRALHDISANPVATLERRPRTRAECAGGPRPCPWVSCRHHLYLDVNPSTGAIQLNHPGVDVEDMAESCSLDIADRVGEETPPLTRMAKWLGVSHERVRQIQGNASAHFAAEVAAIRNQASLRHRT